MGQATSILEPKAQDHGFTITEALVICAVLGLGALTLVPTFAKSGPSSRPFQCLNNLRQLGNAWVMYAEDNRGELVYNTDGGNVGRTADSPSWAAGWLDFSTSGDNTNTAFLIDHNRYPYSAFLGPYIRSPLPFKCPADRSMTMAGGRPFPRVRSVSMNCWVGQKARGWFTGGNFQIFGNVSTVGKMAPASLFVFIEERPDSINDCAFASDPEYVGQVYTLVDYPAAFHLDSCTFSFADGHAELKHWRDPRTMPVLRPGQILSYNIPSPGNSDILWLATHATRKP